VRPPEETAVSIITRDVVMSGQDKYVPLTDAEKKGYLLEFWFTDLTTQTFQYENSKWFPARKQFGRFILAAEDYVMSEHEIKYTNQLIVTEQATLRYLQHHASCVEIASQNLAIDAAVSNYFVQSSLQFTPPPLDIAIAAAYLVFRQNGQNFLDRKLSSFTSQLQQQQYLAYEPRPAPGLTATGVYYSMDNFATGKLSIRSYLFDSACTFPNSDVDSSPNNRASPPATAGGAPVPGSPSNAPPATGTAPPPESGRPPVPTAEDPNPGGPPSKPGQDGPPDQVPGRAYRVKVSFSQAGQARTVFFDAIAPISGIKTLVDGNQFRIWYFTSADAPGPYPSVKTFANDFVNDPFPERQVKGASISLVR
jgi:hypothetical protein